MLEHVANNKWIISLRNNVFIGQSGIIVILLTCKRIYRRSYARDTGFITHPTDYILDYVGHGFLLAIIKISIPPNISRKGIGPSEDRVLFEKRLTFRGNNPLQHQNKQKFGRIFR